MNAFYNQAAPRREGIVDRPLWIAVLGLMGVGAAFIFSATGAHVPPPEPPLSTITMTT